MKVASAPFPAASRRSRGSAQTPAEKSPPGRRRLCTGPHFTRSQPHTLWDPFFLKKVQHLLLMSLNRAALLPAAPPLAGLSLARSLTRSFSHEVSVILRPGPSQGP